MKTVVTHLLPTIVITPSNPCARVGAGAVFPLNPSECIKVYATGSWLACGAVCNFCDVFMLSNEMEHYSIQSKNPFSLRIIICCLEVHPMAMADDDCENGYLRRDKHGDDESLAMLVHCCGFTSAG